MPGRLAIDFGTSNTVVALWDEALWDQSYWGVRAPEQTLRVNGFVVLAEAGGFV